MTQIKRELFNDEYLKEVNSDEYETFLSSLIRMFGTSPRKQDLFFSDFASLLKDKDISNKSLESILMFVLRVIQKLPEKAQIVEYFESHNLF